MGPQRRLGIYVGFDSPFIIRYLEPIIGDVFTAHFADFHFNESVFPPSGGRKVDSRRTTRNYLECIYNVSFDPCINQCELEVQRIIHFQNIVNQFLDAFIGTKKVTKSHIPAANALAWFDVLEEQLENESKIRLKCGRIRLKHGRPIGSKDITPRKMRIQRRIDTLEKVHDKQKASIEAYDKQKALKEVYGKQKALVEAYIEKKPKDV